MIKIDAQPVRAQVLAPLIKSEYRMLYFEDEPILYSGKNSYGGLVLGSQIDEDYESRIHRHFRVEISPSDYSEFVKGRIAFYDILKASNAVWLVEGDFDGNNSEIYLLPFEKIPANYLPAVDSFCPAQKVTPAVDFYASLNGKLADEHKVYPEDLNKAQGGISEMIQSILRGPRLLFDANLLVSAEYVRGSFGINYQVELPGGSLFVPSEEQIAMVAKLTSYVTSAEVGELEIREDGKAAPPYQAVEDSFIASYSKTFPGPAEYARKELSEGIRGAIKARDKAASGIGSSFSSIEIYSGKIKASERILGVIDKPVKAKLEVVEEVETITTKRVHGSWRIQIFDLHRDKGSGWADVYDLKQMLPPLKVRIKIEGDYETLAHTEYTRRYGTKEFLDIDGILEYNGSGEPVKLIVFYDSLK